MLLIIFGVSNVLIIRCVVVRKFVAFFVPLPTLIRSPFSPAFSRC